MRLLYTTLLFIHLLGWSSGRGMFVLHFAVRPAAAGQLPPPQRLPLLATALAASSSGWLSDHRHPRSGIGLILAPADSPTLMYPCT